MGDNFQTIADVEATEAEAGGLAAAVVEWLAAAGVVTPGSLAPGPSYEDAVAVPNPALLRRRPNELEVVTSRTVFWSVGVDAVTCASCGAPVDEDALLGAIDAWHAGGDGLLPCPGCGRPAGLNDWAWDPPWGFGWLGLTFWNWPPLRPEFVAEVSRRLGHRTVLASGRL